MKQTLTTNQVAHLLLRDDNAKWSYEGAHALAEHYEAMEQDSGEEMELDVVAIRCEWTEFKTAHEIAEAYDISCEGDEEDIEDTVINYVGDRSILVRFKGGYLVQQF